VQPVAVDPVAGQVDLWFDRRATAHGEHAGDGWERVEVDTLADLRAQSPCVVGDPGRSGEVGGTGGVCEVLCCPQADVHIAAARVDAWLQAAEQ
jgi:hypothetical protein